MKTLDLALIFQLSISTNDMDRCLGFWRSAFRLNEDSIIRKSTKEIFDRGEYHCRNFLEKEVEFYHKYYRFDVDGLDMEMIEPITKDNINPYTSFLSHGKNGLQHLGVKINNREDLVQDMKQMGIPVYTYAYMGPVEEDVSKRADCYFYDLREQLGIIIEAGGAVVGPLASDPRAGSQASLGLLNSYAARPVLPEAPEIPGITKVEVRDVFQIAVVVKDGEAVLKNWQTFFGLESEKVEHGEIGDLGRFCRISAGGVDIKIIQPSDHGIFRDFLEKSGGNNIMYVSAVTDDFENTEKTFARLGECVLDMPGSDADPSSEGAKLYDLRDSVGLMMNVCRRAAGPHAY